MICKHFFFKFKFTEETLFKKTYSSNASARSEFPRDGANVKIMYIKKVQQLLQWYISNLEPKLPSVCKAKPNLKKRIKKAKVQNRYRSWIPVGPLQDLCRNVNGEKIALIISTRRLGE